MNEEMTYDKLREYDGKVVNSENSPPRHRLRDFSSIGFIVNAQRVASQQCRPLIDVV